MYFSIGTGIMFFILGYIVRKFQLANLIHLYNPKIYDSKKTCNIFGIHFMVAGIVLIILGALHYFGFYSEMVLIGLWLVTTTIVLIKMYYSIFTRARKRY